MVNNPNIRFKGFTDEWEERKLGEVATLSSSKRIHLSDYVTEGIPFYRGSEISTGGITGNQELFISQEKFDEIKEKYGVPSEGDILVTAVGTLGNLWKVDSRRFYYKDGNLIQISKMQVNSDYLLTYFTGGIGKKRLLDSAAGSNQKALTMVKMREITVDFPSEDEQKKIGAFFKSLDDTIALHQRKLDLLKDLKKGYLQKMFPKNGAKVPELRFAGFADDWELCKFKDILKTHSFRSYLSGVSENGEYEVVQQGDKPIAGYSDGEPFTDYKDVTLFGDHTVSVYKPKSPFFVATDGVKILSADNFEGDYLYTTLERYKPEPQGYKRHFTILKNQDVWFTKNMEEQQKIGSFFKQLDFTITHHQRKLDLLKDLKKGLLQQMFV